MRHLTERRLLARCPELAAEQEPAAAEPAVAGLAATEPVVLVVLDPELDARASDVRMPTARELAAVQVGSALNDPEQGDPGPDASGPDALESLRDGQGERVAGRRERPTCFPNRGRQERHWRCYELVRAAGWILPAGKVPRRNAVLLWLEREQVLPFPVAPRPMLMPVQ